MNVYYYVTDAIFLLYIDIGGCRQTYKYTWVRVSEGDSWLKVLAMIMPSWISLAGTILATEGRHDLSWCSMHGSAYYSILCSLPLFRYPYFLHSFDCLHIYRALKKFVYVDSVNKYCFQIKSNRNPRVVANERYRLTLT